MCNKTENEGTTARSEDIRWNITVRNVGVDLSDYFEQPIATTAEQLGVCTTALKKLCRKIGIRRWPYRKFESLNKTIVALEGKRTESLNESELLDIDNQLRNARAIKLRLIKDPDATVALRDMTARPTHSLPSTIEGLPPETESASPSLPAKRAAPSNIQETRSKKPRDEALLHDLESLRREGESLGNYIMSQHFASRGLEKAKDELTVISAVIALVSMKSRLPHNPNPVEPITPPPLQTPPTTPPPPIFCSLSSSEDTPTSATNTATSTPVLTPAPSAPSTPPSTFLEAAVYSPSISCCTLLSITTQLNNHKGGGVILLPPPNSPSTTIPKM
ncbi:hypothetical protein Pelo_14267 [Pelomyxa schiedti]|nr:hypothetical protein Pelo_14267 [Pelomyxa schiedti]